MADIQASIANFAPRVEELLGTLRQTDYAEAALKQQKAYVKDLESELSQLQGQIYLLESKTLIEKAEFEKYRDSNLKRFAYKLGGSKGKDKFQTRTDKEEKEYYEALEQERDAKNRIQSIDLALKEGIGPCDIYQRDNDAHIGAQKELDDLYNMLFAGPTPQFPQEDRSEWQFTQARERFNAIEGRYRAVQQACDMFSEARKHIAFAARHIGDARSASTWDKYGGGTIADMAERDALNLADSEVSQTMALIAQAARVCPDGVQDIPQIQISHGHIWSDMVFDNYFTDSAFHEKIKTSQQQILAAQQSIEMQTQSLSQRLAGQKSERDSAQSDLTSARKHLQDMRTQIFSQLGGQQPPPYQY